MTLIFNCKKLIRAYHSGLLGQTIMPEDSNPGDSLDQTNLRLAYFTLPMALNYQRDSYKLWEAALQTFNDFETADVFHIAKVATMEEAALRKKLLKYKLALQPNKHIRTWSTISQTIDGRGGRIEDMLKACDYDFLKLRELVQKDYKKGFPYLSGPKIFNYWCFILEEYGKVKLSNSEYIEIAPDTHITKCSVKLGVITEKEAEQLFKEEISAKWRKALNGSGIDPINMHPPLWFWSRNGFKYKL